VVDLEHINFTENDLIASICRSSFYEFVKEFWSTIITEKPVWNWHIKYLCNELQKVAENVFLDLPKLYDLIINISPGSTKSTICSVMFQPWVWIRMPEAQFVTASYGHILATDLSRRSRDIIMSERYKQLFPEIILRCDQNVKTNFMNEKGGFRMAVGAGGIVGFHGHFIIIDDPLNPEQAVSEAELKSTNNWITGTLLQRKVNQAKAPTILIMQRLHQDDPTAFLIEKAKEEQRIAILEEGVDAPYKLKHICLPAEKSRDILPRYLKNYYKDGLMDPIRLGKAILREKKTAGDIFYSGQFMQNPIPAGGGMFKADRINIDVLEVHKIVAQVRYWDKAGTPTGKGAFTVGFLMALDTKKRFWIRDVIRGRYSSEIREDLIKQTAIIDGKSVVIGIEQEPGSGGKESAENTVKNLAGFTVRIDKPSGSDSSKEARADPFSVQVNMGNVSMEKGEWNRALIEELRYFPFSKFKDQVDAGSGAFNILSKGMGTVGAFLRNR